MKKFFQKKYITLVLVAILGVLAGITFKTQALQKITIGFDDKYVKGGQQGYDLANLEAKIKAQQKEALKKQEEQLKKMEEEEKQKENQPQEEKNKGESSEEKK